MTSRTMAMVLLPIFLVLYGCSSQSPVQSRMLIFFEMLPPTDESLAYELWYGNDESYTSIQRFSTLTGTVSLSVPITPDLSEATSLILSVEPAGLLSDEPSDTVLLAGDFIGDEAEMTVSHPLSLGTDFSSASGSFRLATPTSSQTTDFDQGIWWFDVAGGIPVQSMFLPRLPQGWIYEAWVIRGVDALSIGKFPDPARFDSDSAGAAASDAVIPPQFPGQDYVNPPELIPGFTALVTAEPLPDFSAEPFGLEILVDQVIEAIDVNQPMENRTERTLPRGSVSKNTGAL